MTKSKIQNKSKYQIANIKTNALLFVICALSLFWILCFVICNYLYAQEPVTSQEKITLDLKGIDIVELFKTLSVKSGLTIIPASDVTGRVTVFLNNLTFEDALEVIVTTQNLAYERKGNLIKIMTAAEYEKVYGQKFGERKETKTIKLSFAKPANIVTILSSLKSNVGKIISDDASGTLILIDAPKSIELMEETIKELDVPLETEVFDINYAKSADIKAYLNDLITPGVGQVIIDERSNKAIVSDLPQRLVKIKKLMLELDETSRQVLITGEIVQITLDDKHSRGIDWERLLSQKRLHGLDFVGKYPVSPTLSAYQKISIGTLSADDYTATLNFLEEFGDVKVVSRPRIVAVNKEEAKILVGAREAYVTSTTSQSGDSTVTSESIEFVDVGVKLKVVPTIGKDGFITMKIKPEVSNVRETITTSAGSQIPIVETSEAESVVKVKDKAMIMIAGLLKEERNDDSNGVPILSRVPGVGAFFGNRVKEKKKTELIVFLSPQLISGDVALNRETKG